MTQEDKDLLSKDICARLPYGVKIKTPFFTTATLISIRKNINYGANKDLLLTYDISGEEIPFQTDERMDTIGKIKPYLFPLSSMTEWQERELEILMKNSIESCGMLSPYDCLEMERFFNENHLDWRGLIPMGLALDATNKNIY